MKKLLLIISITLMFSTSVNAGFWGFMADTKTLLGNKNSGGTHYSTNTDANDEKEKVQQVLAKLGFYKGKFKGNLNTFESRTAIEDFQLHYKLEDTGVLSKKEKQDLLYMHDLLKNYKNLLNKFSKADDKKAKRILYALDKLEKKLSRKKNIKNYLSSKFKKQRKLAKKAKKLLLQKEKEAAKIFKNLNSEERKDYCIKIGRSWQFGNNGSIKCGTNLK